MKLELLLQALPGAPCRGTLNREIAGLACDSRQVRPGWLFVAIPGSKQDGAAYVEDAVARGAAAVVAQAFPANRDVAAVKVADPREALARLASAFYGHPSHRLRVAGVTGTNGKTTVAYMIRDILEAAGFPCGLVGTVEYRLGNRVIPASRTTPDSLTLQSYFAQMLQNGCTAAVMEVSSHALDQARVWGVEFDAAIFTNLTQDHLDYHVTMEAYFEAKKKLFTRLGEAGGKTPAAIVNLDDPYGRRLAACSEIRANVITYGRDPAALVRAEAVRLSAAGTAFRAVTPWGSADATLRLLGAYNISNALAALAAAGSMGVPLAVSLQRLAQMRAVPGRLEEVPCRRGFKVFVDYAHTDDALVNVLQTLREITAGRLIVVFGCGGNRDRTKRPKMGAAAARLADYSVLTSDNPRTEDPLAILEQIRAGMGAAPHEVVPDRAEAIRRALGLAKKGDIVLIAGKGHETFQEFDNRVIPFDDREVAGGMLA